MAISNFFEYLENKVFPALWHRLDTAFPEFNFIQKGKGFWQATNREHSKTLPGSPRPSRIYAYRNTPFGIKIQGGDFIPWLKYLNGMNTPHGQVFIDLVNLVCEKADMPLPEWQPSPEDIQKIEASERQQAIREDFWHYCRNALFTPQGAKALAYAIKRGFTKEQIDSLELGCYPSITEIKAFLLSKDFTEREIGYQAREVRNGKPLGSALVYDGRWEGRLIGVWRNRAGRIINFWARDISGKAEEQEKYLMLKGGTKEAPYGIHLVQGSEVTAVEGFFDALLPLANSIPNVIALGGCQITEAQLKSIEKCGVNSLTVCLDGDPEGQKGTEMSLNLIYESRKFKVFVASLLEKYKDPAEYIRSEGWQAFRKILQTAQNGVKWQAARITQRYDLTTDRGRHLAYQEAVSFKKRLSNPLDIEDFSAAVEKLLGVPFIAVATLEEKTDIQKIHPVEPDILKKLFAQCTIAEFKDAIKNLSPLEILLCQAGTGVGKTFTMLYMMHELNLPAAFICSTLAECYRDASILKSFAPQEKIVLATSDSDISESGQDQSSLSFVEGAKYIITTYAYLGRKGHTAQTYKIAKQLLQDRIVFCDEIQELYHRCEIYLALAARYLIHSDGNENTYRITEKCPKKAKTGDCSSCCLAFKRKAPERRTRERKFYEDFPAEHKTTFQDIPDLEPLKMSKLLFSLYEYLNMHGTLFYMPLTLPSVYSMPVTDAQDFCGYLHSLMATLQGGHIRTEFPLVNGNPMLGEFLKDEKGRITYPVMPCSIPILCGLDLLPLIQLMTYPKNLILASATIPPQFTQVIKNVAQERGWHVRPPIEINEIPFHFNVTVLKTDTQLSIERLARLVLSLQIATEERIFVVTDKRINARRLTKRLQKDIPDKVVLFERQDYESLLEIEKRGGLDVEKKAIVTYGGSAITRGIDLPDVSLLIVDCQQFIPKSGLAGIKPGMTNKEVQKVRVEDIKFKLIQIIGRLLRSKKERIPGQTVQDGRKIVVLLLGLPEGLWNFRLDPRLVQPYREYRGVFVDINDQKMVESIAEAMLKAMKGGEPDDRQGQGKQDLIEKAKTEGIRSIHSEQRTLIAEEWEQSKEERHQAQLEKKLDELANLVLDMKKKGYGWKVIYRKLNLYRYPSLKDQLKEVFDK